MYWIYYFYSTYHFCEFIESYKVRCHERSFVNIFFFFLSNCKERGTFVFVWKRKKKKLIGVNFNFPWFWWCGKEYESYPIIKRKQPNTTWEFKFIGHEFPLKFHVKPYSRTPPKRIKTFLLLVKRKKKHWLRII